jgi:hypothetical protein
VQLEKLEEAKTELEQAMRLSSDPALNKLVQAQLKLLSKAAAPVPQSQGGASNPYP